MDQVSVSAIRTRYDQVREKIDAAARKVGRNPDSVRLVVVTKTHPLETVRAALEAGIRDFGENYAEEAVEKIQAIGAVEGLRWHMIGHVQSRKADLVAQNFNFMHSLDSLKLANRLERFAAEAGRVLPVLLECNVGGERSKAGYPVFEAALWDALHTETGQIAEPAFGNWVVQKSIDILCAEAEQIAQLPHLEIRGLMTMPPLYDDAEKTRPFFRRLVEVRDILAKRLPRGQWDELSMGTSADFRAAVEQGATLVRVGTAILGARPPKG